MVKRYGPDRLVEQYHMPFAEVSRTVAKMKASGKYSEVEQTSNGGIFAIENGKARHKADEIAAGKHMANAGYHVTLKDETGMVKTPDGHVFSFSFEQKTPSVGGAYNVRKALGHARSKNADVAVIYDKYTVYHRNVIEHGISLFESKNTYRFKRIIVISKSGGVYEHSHNK